MMLTILLMVKRMRRKISNPLILAITAVAGTVGTAILSAIGTKKAMENPDKNPVPYYIPAACAAAGTITCILGLHAVHSRRHAKLVSAVMLLQSTLSEYQNYISEKDRDELEQARIEANREELEALETEDPELLLFYEPFTQTYFNAREAFVKDAIININRNLQYRGYASIGEFLDILDLADNDLTGTCDLFGWSTWSLIQYWQVKWIDIDYHKVIMDDGLECYVIEYNTTPDFDEDTYPNARGDYILEAISQN